MCLSNQWRPAENFEENVRTLRRRDLIDEAVEASLLRLWEDRDDYHHLNAGVARDRAALLELALIKIRALSEVEGFVFAWGTERDPRVPEATSTAVLAGTRRTDGSVFFFAIRRSNNRLQPVATGAILGPPRLKRHVRATSECSNRPFRDCHSSAGRYRTSCSGLRRGRCTSSIWETTIRTTGLQPRPASALSFGVVSWALRS